jgi:hypothetical protein
VTKIFTGTLLGAGLLAGYNYYKKIKRTQTELDIVPNAYLHQINWEKITIRVEVLVKNPTKGSFTIKFPYVKILYKDATVGSSQAVNKNITIPAYGQIKIEKLLVDIPVTNLFNTAAAMLKEIQNKKSVKIKLKIMSTVDLGLMSVPYETIEEVTIKK